MWLLPAPQMAFFGVYKFVLSRSLWWLEGCTHQSFSVLSRPYFYSFFSSCFVFCANPFLFFFHLSLNLACFLMVVRFTYKILLTNVKCIYFSKGVYFREEMHGTCILLAMIFLFSSHEWHIHSLCKYNKHHSKCKHKFFYVE